jgi:hypothetical protein
VLAASTRVIYILNGRRGTIRQAREEDALVTFDEDGCTSRIGSGSSWSSLCPDTNSSSRSAPANAALRRAWSRPWDSITTTPAARPSGWRYVNQKRDTGLVGFGGSGFFAMQQVSTASEVRSIRLTRPRLRLMPSGPGPVTGHLARALREAAAPIRTSPRPSGARDRARHHERNQMPSE